MRGGSQVDIRVPDEYTSHHCFSVLGLQLSDRGKLSQLNAFRRPLLRPLLPILLPLPEINEFISNRSLLMLEKSISSSK